MFGNNKRKKSDDEVKAFLGSETEFHGKLVFSGFVRIDGSFQGDILGGDMLIAGEGARIEGNILVDNIIISGEVSGNLVVKEKVEIDAKGRFFGDVISSVLVVQEGAVFEGNCRMDRGRTGLKQGDITGAIPFDEEADRRILTQS